MIRSTSSLPTQLTCLTFSLPWVHLSWQTLWNFFLFLSGSKKDYLFLPLLLPRVHIMLMNSLILYLVYSTVKIKLFVRLHSLSYKHEIESMVKSGLEYLIYHDLWHWNKLHTNIIFIKNKTRRYEGCVSSVVNRPYPSPWFRFKHVEPISFFPNLSFDKSSLNDLTNYLSLTYQQ